MRFSIPVLIGALIASVAASNVLELTPNNFYDVVGKVPTFVQFFSPWCGHCEDIPPVWEQVADAFEHAKDKVVIAKVDADSDGVGRPLGTKYGVTAFPTMKFFDKDGVESLYELKEGRDLGSFVAFVTKKTGIEPKIPIESHTTAKVVDDNFDGELNDVKAGRVADYNAIAKQFVASAAGAREAFVKGAAALANQAGNAVKGFYDRAFEKVAGGAK